MTHHIRKRIIRSATEDENERHSLIREQAEQDLPELKEWARGVASRHRERVTVGTVLGAQEAPILEAIDDYAARHSLSGRAAVVREALSRLLGIEIQRQ